MFKNNDQKYLDLVNLFKKAYLAIETKNNTNRHKSLNLVFEF